MARNRSVATISPRRPSVGPRLAPGAAARRGGCRVWAQGSDPGLPSGWGGAGGCASGVHVPGEPAALPPVLPGGTVLLPGGTVLLPGPHPAEGAQALLEKRGGKMANVGDPDSWGGQKDPKSSPKTNKWRKIQKQYKEKEKKPPPCCFPLDLIRNYFP